MHLVFFSYYFTFVYDVIKCIAIGRFIIIHECRLVYKLVVECLIRVQNIDNEFPLGF